MEVKKWYRRASNSFWASTIAAFVIAVVVATVGVIIEGNSQDTSGLIMIILSGVLLALAGIFATVAAKFEAKEEQGK